MSLEAMETLTAAEERLKKQRASAAAAAKQALTDAGTQGEGMVAEAVRKAEEALKALNRETDEKAKTAAETLAGEGAARREELRAKAKAREEEAVSFVVERIVNG